MSALRDAYLASVTNGCCAWNEAGPCPGCVAEVDRFLNFIARPELRAEVIAHLGGKLHYVPKWTIGNNLQSPTELGAVFVFPEDGGQ